MSEAPDQDQKTEEPTEKKRRDAAREGDVLKSRELLIAGVTLCGVAYLVLAGELLFAGLGQLLAEGLSFDAGDVRDFDMAARSARLLGSIAPELLGLFFLTMVAAVCAQALLGGLRFNLKAVKFKGSKLSPLSGMKRMVSMNALIELLKSLLKVALIGAVGACVLWLGRNGLLALGYADVPGAIALAGGTLALLLFALAGGLALVAAVDVPVQMLQLKKKLRMTRQELKDEHKQAEGSPEMRAAQRQRQREAIRRDVRAGVDTANVVLTNPAHFAVALRYERGSDAAPVIVAAGKGERAAVIRELAEASGKPVLRYPQLTRALYFSGKPGEQVKSELFVAVATVLAFIFEVDRDLARQKPSVDVPRDFRFDANGELDARRRA